MKAVGYVRISTEDQSVYSIESQRRQITEYCQRNNLTLVDIFEDRGESSYTFDRPDWQKLEQFIKGAKVQYLVVYELDRFSRNLAEALQKIKELQSRYNIKVVTVSDPIDTDTADPMQFMMRAFKLMVAESELHRIRQRTRAGMLQAALNGRHANMAPFGYRNARDSEDKPIIVIDEDRAAIVRFIFKEYLRGVSVTDIKRMVIPMGFTLQGRSAIQHILSNPVYAGMVKIPASKGSPARTGKGLHQAIISEADYWNVQKQLEGKTIRKQVKEEVPLRGVIRCPQCGHLMTAGNSKGKSKYYWYYLCNVHRVNYSATTAHRKMNEILDLLSFTPEVVEWFREELSKEIASHIESKGDTVAQLNKALRATEDKLREAEERYLLGDTSKVAFDRVAATLRSKAIDYQKRIYELNAGEVDYYQRLSDTLPLLYDLRGTVEAMSLHNQQAFFRLVFDDRLSYDGEVYRTPYIDPVFSHNALTLKEKGLLLLEQPLQVSDESPMCAPDRAFIEHKGLLDGFQKLLEVLAA